jgi:hypothetical protein
LFDLGEAMWTANESRKSDMQENFFGKMTSVKQEDEKFKRNTVNKTFGTPLCLFTLQLNAGKRNCSNY